MLKLIANFDEFEQQVLEYEKSLKRLHEIDISTVEDLTDFASALYGLDKKIQLYLQSSFTSQDNRYVNQYSSKAQMILSQGANESNFKRLEKGIKNLIPDRKEMLRACWEILIDSSNENNIIFFKRLKSHSNSKQYVESS